MVQNAGHVTSLRYSREFGFHGKYCRSVVEHCGVQRNDIDGQSSRHYTYIVVGELLVITVTGSIEFGLLNG